MPSKMGKIKLNVKKINILYPLTCMIKTNPVK